MPLLIASVDGAVAPQLGSLRYRPDTHSTETTRYDRVYRDGCRLSRFPSGRLDGRGLGVKRTMLASAAKAPATAEVDSMIECQLSAKSASSIDGDAQLDFPGGE